ncbi:MAG: AAA family ATPase [Patescibacteria group bacterium]
MVFHPATELQLESYASRLPGALLITGPEGIGLTSASRFVSSKSKAVTYTVFPEKDEKPDIEKGTITVDSIRRLYDLTKTIEPNGRVVVIDYAERMAKPAQNAFLKLLEEPSEGTHFILLTHQPELLLPTILSRVQRLDLRSITKEQSEELLDSLKVRDDRQKAQLLFIAGGLPAELTRLVTDATYFEHRSGIIKDAREYVIGNAYSRLLIAKKYKDNRAQALTMIADAMRLLQNTLVNGGDASSIATITQLEEVYGRIQGNGNIRLQLASI